MSTMYMRLNPTPNDVNNTFVCVTFNVRYVINIALPIIYTFVRNYEESDFYYAKSEPVLTAFPCPRYPARILLQTYFPPLALVLKHSTLICKILVQKDRTSVF